MGTQPHPLRFPVRTAALALTAALAAGCAAGPAPSYVPSTTAAEERGLEVRLPSPYALDQGPWALFHLNKPAYVAIFEVRPGLGVEALFPYGSGAVAQRRFPAGMNTVLRHRRPSPVRLASGVAGMSGRYACLQEAQSPIVYRMIVASERPLRLERLQSYVSFQLRPALQSRHFAFGSPLDTMDDLLHMVLPSRAAWRSDDGAVNGSAPWAADYVAYWHSDPRCVGLLATAPFSPVQRLGSGPHPATPGSPIGEPAEPGEPGEPGEENEEDVAGERPERPAETPDRSAPPIRDRDDGLPGDRPGETGNADARRAGFPGAWTPEERHAGTPDQRGLEVERAAPPRTPLERRTGAERQRLLPERTDPAAFERLRVLEGRRAASARPDRPGVGRDRPTLHERLRGTAGRPLVRPSPRAGVHATPRANPRPSAEREGPRARPPPRAQPPARPQVRPSSPPPRSSSGSSGSGGSDRDARDSRN